MASTSKIVGLLLVALCIGSARAAVRDRSASQATLGAFQLAAALATGTQQQGPVQIAVNCVSQGAGKGEQCTATSGGLTYSFFHGPIQFGGGFVAGSVMCPTLCALPPAPALTDTDLASIGLSASGIKIFRANALKEGGGNFGAINTYDDQIFSWGMAQFSALAGNVGGVLVTLQTLYPQVYQNYFVSRGITARSTGPWAGAFALAVRDANGRMVEGQPGLQVLRNDMKHIATFLVASQRKEVMLAQSAYWLQTFYSPAVNFRAPGAAPLFQLATSERALSAVVRLYNWMPAYMTDWTTAFIRSNNAAQPAAWNQAMETRFLNDLDARMVAQGRHKVSMVCPACSAQRGSWIPNGKSNPQSLSNTQGDSPQQQQPWYQRLNPFSWGQQQQQQQPQSPAQPQQACTIPATGAKGVCLDVAQCSGQKVSSLQGAQGCEALAANVQCCVQQAQQPWYQRLNPFSSGQQQPQQPQQATTSCTVPATGAKGVCLDVTQCRGQKVPAAQGAQGCEALAANVQCCVQQAQQPWYQRLNPFSSGQQQQQQQQQPQQTTTACTVPATGAKGVCLDVAQCRGQKVSSLQGAQGCGAFAANVQCCVQQAQQQQSQWWNPLSWGQQQQQQPQKQQQQQQQQQTSSQQSQWWNPLSWGQQQQQQPQRQQQTARCPLVLPVNGKSSRGYRADHFGIDIYNTAGGAPQYTVAAAAGTVTFALNTCVDGNQQCGGGAGNMVQIDHASGWRTVYMHHRTGSVLVTTGQQVQQGQRLGLMGNTGFSFGEHLHFELVRIAGNAKVDPCTGRTLLGADLAGDFHLNCGNYRPHVTVFTAGQCAAR